MKAHQHDWQYVKEVRVDEWDRLAWKTNRAVGVYLKFVCHCGAVKYVEQKEVKE